MDPEQKGIGEGKAPSGSKVTVTTADTVLMTATIPNLEASAGYTHEQVQSNASDALRDYLKNINPGGVVRVREAQSEVIKAEGVLDTGDLLLDDSRNNITLSTTELADLGEVTFS
ncbi:hypothetical protein DXT76_13760 [Halobacillus trueperi]|uniref:Baseplate J-like C-terminal domain-containing protein n=1 Tax=Halobacillus trueperi TaxID=156205 RepID=A0A3D8VLM6_9BACI|nr:hypothetical protein DXT76_13760 [Halobacillus trueperi]